MRLQISLPTVVAEKLHQLALQERRPLPLQAEFMLCRAVHRAQLKPEFALEERTLAWRHATEGSLTARERHLEEVRHAPE